MLDPNRPSIPPSVSCTREEAGSALVVETVAEKDGVGVSASRGGPKPRPETREKRSHRADPSSKKVAKESSAQPNDEEEETKSAHIHRKRKIPVQAGPQVGEALYWAFFPYVGLGFD